MLFVQCVLRNLCSIVICGRQISELNVLLLNCASSVEHIKVSFNYFSSRIISNNS
jgi:hypothetical protein